MLTMLLFTLVCAAADKMVLEIEFTDELTYQQTDTSIFEVESDVTSLCQAHYDVIYTCLHCSWQASA